MIRGSSWMITGSLLWFSSHVYAADQGTGYLQYQEPQTAAFSSFSTISYIGTLIVAFAVVIALAYFTSRFIARKARGYGLGDNSKILQVIPLGANRAVYVIDILGKVMVLGVTEHSITILDEIDDDEALKKIRAIEPQVAIASTDVFQQLFKRQVTSLQKLSQLFPTTDQLTSVKFPRSGNKTNEGGTNGEK